MKLLARPAAVVFDKDGSLFDTEALYQDACLVAHGLSDRFAAVVAQGDHVRSKPAPDPFLKAAERPDVEPGACLALEDWFNGIRSAAAARMITVMVPVLVAPTDEILALCRFVVEDLHVVRRLVLAAA